MCSEPRHNRLPECGTDRAAAPLLFVLTHSSERRYPPADLMLVGDAKGGDAAPVRGYEGVLKILGCGHGHDDAVRDWLSHTVDGVSSQSSR